MCKNEYIYAMSQNDEEWTHFNVRCLASFRKEAEASAERQGQSFAEWIRRAMQEKLEREKTGYALRDPQLDAIIEEIVDRKLAQKKEG